MAPRHVNLTNRLNPWYLEEDGTVFLRQSGVEVGLQYWLPEASGLTTEQVEALFETYQTMIESNGVQGSRLRFMTFHRPLTEEETQEMPFGETNDPVQSALIQAEQRDLRERVLNGELNMHETFVFIHIPETRPGVSRSENRGWHPAEAEEIIRKANDERDRVISAFLNAGIPAAPLVAEDPYRLMWRWYNLGQIQDAPPSYDWDYELSDVTRAELLLNENIRERTLRSQVCNSDLLTERREYLQNGDTKIVVSDMTNYGKKGFPGLADRVLANLRDYTYMYIVDVSFSKESSIKNRVERQVTAAEKLAEEGGRREAAAKAAQMGTEAMRAYQNGNRFVRFGMSTVVACRTDREVQQVRNLLKNQWNDNGRHQMSAGTYSNWEQYAFNLGPYSGRTTDFMEDQSAGDIPFFLPHYGPWYNSGGVTLGLFENDYGTQQRITLPRDNEGASHMAVMGGSGSGKSFTIMKLLMNLYMMGASLRIMDIKKDYKPLTMWLKGQFIKCTPGAVFSEPTLSPRGELMPPGTSVTYNIFEGRTVDDPQPELTPDDLRDILGFLKALIAQPLSKEENTVLTAAVEQFTTIRHDVVQGVRVFRGALLADFVNYLLTMTRMGNIGLNNDDENFKRIPRQLGIVLQAFTQGVYGRMFNGPTTINPTGRVVVYDLSDLKENDPIIGAIFMMINKDTYDKARKRADRTQRIVLVSEETGQTGKIPEVEALLNSVVMVGRAFGLMLIVVAQNSESMTALGGVLNNINRMILGRCTSEEANVLANMLKLNTEQEAALTRLGRVAGKYNQMMVREVKPDGTAVLGKIVYSPTALEYALFSSDPADSTRRDRIMAESAGDLKYAVRRLADEQRAANGN